MTGILLYGMAWHEISKQIMLDSVSKKEEFMYGFEAISAYNGWSMSIVGVLIVFSGLVILSITISQIHKVL
ncbi:MAG: OadG family protein, partial [Desulfosarcina sp.]|nr:OadG family protein [Desulfobacterales bacterium]